MIPEATVPWHYIPACGSFSAVFASLRSEPLSPDRKEEALHNRASELEDHNYRIIAPRLN